ncbi:UDP-glucose dehydrogenase [Caenispirillum salinarum AK4]|uniref:UDP-glucose dehydrogenase n=1 Tax=Caenispirillum salinarum AK4 TaxID=1238182 RepID=K9GX29_9PROT|nr:nucleotide sugar dehydrogenase [Caenispirillum salinarum]EKV29797.1 UDP-glucose dehydrogenase [Caenispirillum salinarum AK4]
MSGLEGRPRIAVVGIGYVGLPVALAFASVASHRLIAFDTDPRRVEALARGVDETGEVSAADLKAADLRLTDDPAALAEADVHIVTVPTPVTEAHVPDLEPVRAAADAVGRHLRPGGTVVFESTLYPGATEQALIPVLEAASGLRCGRDFGVGYSPERINPGDTDHRFTNTAKVLAGSDSVTTEGLLALYGRVVEAPLHVAPSIAVAEAGKVLENTQRDVNIALMNEMALICHRLGLDSRDVLAAAGTKWNFLPFTPGLVGGHCIGVDPWFLAHRAEDAGAEADLVRTARRVNERVPAFIANEMLRRLMHRRSDGPPVVTVLGLSFKPDVPDLRNSKVLDIIAHLRRFDITVQVVDPVVPPATAPVPLTAPEDCAPADGVLVAVAHRAFRDAGWPLIARLLARPDAGVVADVPGLVEPGVVPRGVDLWWL